MSRRIKGLKKHKVSRETIKRPNLPRIEKGAVITHPLFNFAFISRKRKFGLRAAKKDTRYEYALLKKLNELSAEKDLTSCIELRKNAGIEPLPASVIKPPVNTKFLNSEVYKYCSPSFYAFRTNKKGRVVGCIWQNANIFYILFLDPNHKVYKG